MVEVKWIKLWVDMFDNRKIRKLRRLPNGLGDTILAIWFELLALAGRCNEGGFLFAVKRDKQIPYDLKMLAEELDRDENIVKTSVEYFLDNNMVDCVDNAYFIANWKEYQSDDKLAEIREKKRIAMQKWREKQKQLVDTTVDITVDITVGATPLISNSISNISNNNSNSNIVNKDINKNINIINKELYKAFGEYEWIKLKQSQYDKLKTDYPGIDIDNQIKLLDEYVQSNGNKNKYKDFNLVLRKSIRENWFNDKSSTKKEKAVPKWFDEFAEKSANTPQVKPNIPSSTLEELESFFNVKKEK